MTHPREKRLLLGGLAILVPLPLPFNEVVSWVVLLVYWTAVGFNLRRSFKGEVSILPTWAMNLLALAYLPILFLDVTVLWQGRILRPLVHLAMFTLVVKLFALRSERDKWHVFLLCFFLFLAAMGSSVHPTMLVYLTAYLATSLLVLARFAAFHVLTSYGERSSAYREIPMRRFLTGCVAVTLLSAGPLFVFLPRLGSPYVVPPGIGASGQLQGAGFTDQFHLDVIGRVRTSRTVALRLRYRSRQPVRHEMRFKTAVYEDFAKDSWSKGEQESIQLRRSTSGFFEVIPGQPRLWVSVWLQPGSGDSLALPVEALTVDLDVPSLRLFRTGVTSLYTRPPGTLEYQVGMTEASGLNLGFADMAENRPSRPVTDGIPARVAALAAEVAGGGPPAEQATRLERFLLTEYQYTLDLVGSSTASPIEDFLFDWRRGHCEYFASALVLMLRSVGIPARLVTGYLGGELNSLEGYYIVRQSNAHAWVEAWIPDGGSGSASEAGAWRLYDPTPPDGRPGLRPSDWGLLFSQAWDFMVFRWDRYVLTYGFYDQMFFLRGLRDLWRALWRDDGPREGPRISSSPTPEEQAGPEPDGLIPGSELGPEAWLPMVLAILAAGLWIWRHRPPFTALRAYRRLRSSLGSRVQEPLEPSLPPLAMGELLAERWPGAAATGRRIIGLYLRESYGGQPLDEEEREGLKGDLRQAVRRLRKGS